MMDLRDMAEEIAAAIDRIDNVKIYHFRQEGCYVETNADEALDILRDLYDALARDVPGVRQIPWMNKPHEDPKKVWADK